MSWWLGYGLTRAASELIQGELAGKPYRDEDYLLPDEKARQAAVAQLEADPEVDTAQLTVRVLSGVLELLGSVPTEAMKARAEQLCSALPHVHKIENKLSVA